MSDNDHDTKLAKPVQFNGDKEKFRSWWNTIRLYIDLHPKNLNTDKKRIACVLSYMQEGQAAKWATLLTERFLGEGWPTYAKFREKMEDQFVSPMTKEKARAQLERLTQGSRPVDEFNTIIFPLIVDADIEDEMEIIRRYRRAIKPAIRRRIEDLDRSICPKTLTEWMGKAEEIDNDWRAYNEDDKDRANRGKPSSNTPHPHPPDLQLHLPRTP